MSPTTGRPIVSDSELESARVRGTTRARTEPRADRADYDSSTGRLVITLRSGASVAIPVEQIDEIATASPELLATVHASRTGDAIELEALDVDISVVGLLRDLAGPLGSLAASEFGRRGGRARSALKTAAARANGAKGGRPRKRSLRAD